MNGATMKFILYTYLYCYKNLEVRITVSDMVFMHIMYYSDYSSK